MNPRQSVERLPHSSTSICQGEPVALEFPFNDPPGKGNAVSVHPDVKWLRSPLPMSLNHINCYLLRDGDGWAVLDTGMNGEAARQQWLDVIASELDGAPLTRVIVTHHHPDHVGLAGWLCDNHRIPLFMSESEYFHTCAFNAPRRKQPYWQVDDYFRKTGMSLDSQQSLYANDDYNHVVSEVPAAYHRVVDQQILQIGDYQWRAITSRGHAPEHLSLYCAEMNLYLSGDQLLPKITSNISVSPIAPDADPLADWLLAHERLATLLPDHALVLPAHQLPFRGVHTRLQQVVDHHHERLDALEQLCNTPRNAQQLTQRLFDRKLDAFQNFLAVGECLAHLHRLLALGRVQCHLQEGVHIFSS